MYLNDLSLAGDPQPTTFEFKPCARLRAKIAHVCACIYVRIRRIALVKEDYSYECAACSEERRTEVLPAVLLGDPNRPDVRRRRAGPGPRTCHEWSVTT